LRETKRGTKKKKFTFPEGEAYPSLWERAPSLRGKASGGTKGNWVGGGWGEGGSDVVKDPWLGKVSLLKRELPQRGKGEVGERSETSTSGKGEDSLPKSFRKFEKRYFQKPGGNLRGS